MTDDQPTAEEQRRATLRKLFPLNFTDADHGDFARLWQGMMSYAAGIHASCAVPGRPGQIDFSGALLALKRGFLVARVAWQEKHPAWWLTLQTGYPQGIDVNANTSAATGIEPGNRAVFLPYVLKCVGNRQVDHGIHQIWVPAFEPWTPDTGDLLAEDWLVIGSPGEPPAEPEDDVVVKFADKHFPVRPS